MIRTVTAIRYVTPLREGGSLPAIVEADDGLLYAMKFVGAGQGAKALIAELIAGELARLSGFNVPEIVFIQLEPVFGRSEPDPEIQDLLRASTGLNLGLRYLSNASAFSLLLNRSLDPLLASQIVWFDAYVTNVDRTPRNVNMLIWQEALWLIDHGAALYFHHSWDDYLARSRSPFPLIKDHALITRASRLPEAGAGLQPRLTPEAIHQIVAAVPEAWLNGETQFAGVIEHRQAYVNYLLNRLEAAPIFVEEAMRARAKLV